MTETGSPDGVDGWPEDWRFLPGRITETVATTRPARAPDGSDVGAVDAGPVNVAPMGVRSDPGDPEAFARLWAGSDTLANVRATGRVTVNFTRDPLIYARAALSDDTDAFVDDAARDVAPAGRLADPDAWAACTAERVGTARDGDVERWQLEPRDGALRRRGLRTVDRGFNAVVEAAVHATRLHVDPELHDSVADALDLAWRCGDDRCREAARYVAAATDVAIPGRDDAAQ